MIKRDYYLKKLIDSKENGLVKIVTGIRRCGKSYLLFNIYYEYLIDNGVDEKHIITLALDEIGNNKYRNPIHLDNYVREKIVNDGKMNYVFIDEIQFVKEIDNEYLPGDKIGFIDVLLGLMRMSNVDVYVTGSNSKMLSSDVITQFRGRGYEIRIHPITFKEYYESLNNLVEKANAFENYMIYGGMPQIFSFDDEKKSEYLKLLLQNVYVKDVIERNNIKNDSLVLNELLDCVSSSIGSLTSPKKLSNTFNSVANKKISSETVSKYLSYFEDAFLINKARRYDIKGKAYIDSPCKYYFEDIGVRNARLGFKEQDRTHIMENIIYNELIVRGFNVDVGVIEHYVKDDEMKTQRIKYEIDFVCNKGNNRLYIQSAYAIPNNVKNEQEIRGFKKIDDSYQKIIVTRENRKPLKDDNGILYIGIEEFLLNDKYTSND